MDLGKGGGEALCSQTRRPLDSSTPHFPREDLTHATHAPCLQACMKKAPSQVNQLDDKCLELHLRKGSQGEYWLCVCFRIRGRRESLKVTPCR